MKKKTTGIIIVTIFLILSILILFSPIEERSYLSKATCQVVVKYSIYQLPILESEINNGQIADMRDWIRPFRLPITNEDLELFGRTKYWNLIGNHWFSGKDGFATVYLESYGLLRYRYGSYAKEDVLRVYSSTRETITHVRDELIQEDKNDRNEFADSLSRDVREGKLTEKKWESVRGPIVTCKPNRWNNLGVCLFQGMKVAIVPNPIDRWQLDAKSPAVNYLGDLTRLGEWNRMILIVRIKNRETATSIKCITTDPIISGQGEVYIGSNSGNSPDGEGAIRVASNSQIGLVVKVFFPLKTHFHSALCNPEVRRGVFARK